MSQNVRDPDGHACKARELRPAVEFLPSIRHHPYVQELEARLRLACEPCAECGHIDWRELDDVLEAPNV